MSRECRRGGETSVILLCPSGWGRQAERPVGARVPRSKASGCWVGLRYKADGCWGLGFKDSGCWWGLGVRLVESGSLGWLWGRLDRASPGLWFVGEI